jgi:nitrogen fixation/metabolism regulation signal transduction histidine kinase
MLKLKQFKVQLILRTSILFISLLLLASGIASGSRSLSLIVLVIAIAIQVFLLLRYIDHTNHELESFLAGLRFGDFQQTYTIADLGPSFSALEKTVQNTVLNLKTARGEREQLATYYRALLQHIPIPFFIVHRGNRIRILNNATRRTFNVSHIRNTDELVRFGAAFQRDVLQIQAGESLLTTIEVSGNPEYFIMTATQLTTRGSVHMLISLQNVQGALDATELATWQNMLRVTSHEVLNSLAPVSSCAQTAKELADSALARDQLDDQSREELQDIRESVDTVLRRSEGLVRFIQSYRQLSRMPKPKKEKIEVATYFSHLSSLLGVELSHKQIEIRFSHAPSGLAMLADEDMLDQAIINLIRNASEALTNTDNAEISVVGSLDDKQRTVIEVSDNGPGVSPEIVEKIFVPYFTARTKGSGVGLALVRYIMLSHGGSVNYAHGEVGGSTFRLVF